MKISSIRAFFPFIRFPDKILLLKEKLNITSLTGTVVDLCIHIHSNVGPGCFEKVYEEILYYELNKKGLRVERQVLLPVSYKTLFIPNAYKIDLLVENKLILEIKSVFPLAPVFFKQVRTYLSLLNLKNGMLLNFQVNLMKEGIFRIYNNSGSGEVRSIISN